MKNNFTLILALLFINFTFGQKTANKSELYVINAIGAKVYEEPTFESKTLAELPLGEIIVLEKTIPTEKKLQVGNGFLLSGNWIKPEKISGFIFSSDLTDKKIEIIKTDDRISINLLGKLMDKKEEKKLIKTDNGEFPKHFEYKYYENGTYTYIAWDGCFDHITEYKNLTLNEVYHQMINDYGVQFSDGEFKIPTIREYTGKIIEFDAEGATKDLKIELKENGNITVSSYDCT